MIYFDELSYCEKMHDEGRFIKAYSVTELTVYAKWLKYKKAKDIGKDVTELTEDENKEINKCVEKELIAFSKAYYPDFNYVINYNDIDKAVARTDVSKLKLPYPTVITKNEWQTISAVSDEDCRRVLFIMLVDAKYNHNNNFSINNPKQSDAYWTRMSLPEILKFAKVKYKGKANSVWIWYEICNKLDLIGVAHTRNGTKRYIKFADEDSKELIRVTDYEHVDLYYDKLNGVNIGECEYCGKLFKQNKFGNILFCKEHRGYIRQKSKKTKEYICSDCGQIFIKNVKSTSKTRCDKCQEDYRKKYKHDKYRQEKDIL